VGIADTELKRLLRTASVMLYTPHLEPFGLAAVEAMASGTPVVAVREAGPAETVVDGVTGFLRERNAPQLAEAVLRVLDDSVLREQMGRAAREHCVQNWTWDRAVEQLQVLLSEAAETTAASHDGARSERKDGPALSVVRRQS
jgi:glycosyltransferase involved in cell wall biosynthesis